MKRYLGVLISIVLMPGIYAAKKSVNFRFGIENFSPQQMTTWCQSKEACPMSLITNQTGKDQFGRRSIDLLLDQGVNLKYLLAPEHGFNGAVGAEQDVSDSIEAKTNIPIVSLYGLRWGTGKALDKKVLEGSDVILFDIQDSGMRHYTYISTLLHAMEDAAKHKKTFVVFDRPNLLGGRMEGPLVDSAIESFISRAPVPVRHGMTMGELAKFFNTHVLEEPTRLFVVPMSGYGRVADTNSSLLAPLSPNLVTTKAAHAYSFLGMLGEAVNVAWETDLAYQALLFPKEKGLSEEQWERLSAILKRYGVDNVPIEQYSARKKIQCRGVRVAVNDINKLHSFDLFIDLLDFFHKEKAPLWFSHGFDKAVGTDRVQELFKAGMNRAMREQLMDDIQKDLQAFVKKARSSFLYDPHPTVDVAKESAGRA